MMFRHLRPIFLGIMMFAVINLIATLVVTFYQPINHKFNGCLDNYLPEKLVAMDRTHTDEGAADVLFLGTSQTNNGFSTRDFEEGLPVATNSFNLGLPGTHYDVMYANLETYRRSHGNPRLLMLEVSPSNMEKSSTQFYLPALQYRSMLEKHPDMLFHIWTSPLMADNVRKEVTLSSFSAFYQFRPIFSPLNIQQRVASKVDNLLAKTMLTASAQSTNFSSDNNDGPYGTITMEPSLTEKGWHPKAISPTMLTPEGTRLNAQEARKFYLDRMGDINFDKLDYLLTHCKKNNIPVVLVNWPNHPTYLAHFQNSRFYNPYQRGLRQMIRKHRVSYVDLSLAPGTNLNGMFSDTRHLSPKGAQRVSRHLAKRVAALPGIRRKLSSPPAMLVAR
jgi:hypothetical protein